MVEVPISSLANPLDGTFDLSAFGDASSYISIHTGYKKGKIAANAGKMELWVCPKFLGATAPQFARIMGQWESPIAYFWTWGGHVVKSDNFDYLFKTDVCTNNELSSNEMLASPHSHHSKTSVTHFLAVFPHAHFRFSQFYFNF